MPWITVKGHPVFAGGEEKKTEEDHAVGRAIEAAKEHVGLVQNGFVIMKKGAKHEEVGQKLEAAGFKRYNHEERDYRDLGTSTHSKSGTVLPGPVTGKEVRDYYTHPDFPDHSFVHRSAPPSQYIQVNRTRVSSGEWVRGISAPTIPSSRFNPGGRTGRFGNTKY